MGNNTEVNSVLLCTALSIWFTECKFMPQLYTPGENNLLSSYVLPHISKHAEWGLRESGTRTWAWPSLGHQQIRTCCHTGLCHTNSQNGLQGWSPGVPGSQGSVSLSCGSWNKNSRR